VTHFSQRGRTAFLTLSTRRHSRGKREKSVGDGVVNFQQKNSKQQYKKGKVLLR
jgi:hypothetical protein